MLVTARVIDNAGPHALHITTETRGRGDGGPLAADQPTLGAGDLPQSTAPPRHTSTTNMNRTATTTNQTITICTASEREFVELRRKFLATL